MSQLEKALSACRLLVAAYNRGRGDGGSIDWDDVDSAHTAAKGALRKAEPKKQADGANIRLYYANYTDCNGDCNDLYVSATSPRQAYDLWGAYYDDSNKRGGAYDNMVRIDEVPACGNRAAAHSWADIAHVGSFDAETGSTRQAKAAA